MYIFHDLSERVVVKRKGGKKGCVRTCVYTGDERGGSGKRGIEVKKKKKRCAALKEK